MMNGVVRRTALIVACVLGLIACGSEQGPGVRERAVAPAGEWVELSASPLEPRSHVVGVWSGHELFLFGGDSWLCPPNADCAIPEEPPLADGAAFNPGTGSWRTTASAPAGFAWASTAVVGDDIYFLVSGIPGWYESAFLRYSIGADAWEQLAQPPGELGWYQLVAAGGALVAVNGSDEQEPRPDLVFDPSGGAWEELPPDPLGPGFGRVMAWSQPYLYLFDSELVPNPGSTVPSLTRAARLDVRTHEWTRLPDSEILGTGPWFVEDELLVNPALGGADGGEVNNWGRTYPYGGVFDTTLESWSPLPAAPKADEHSAGILGSRDALIYGTEGLLLDLGSNTWIELPALLESGDYTQRQVITAGRDAVVFGGQRWDGDHGELLGDAWIWRAGGAS